MKLLVVVSEFPKITETFAIANVLHYMSKGHDVQVFHLKPFRHGEVVHEESLPVVERAFTFPWFSGTSMRALFHSLARRPRKTISMMARILEGTWRDPQRLLQTLLIFPQSLALGRHALSTGVSHIHAEFASHPATASWIASEVYGVSFSFSAHMYDIFVSQSLLAEKSKNARFVRTISEFNRAFLSEIDGFAADKIELVRCGISPTRFPPRAVARPALDRARHDLTFVGSLQPRKGVDVLLRALVHLRSRDDWHLKVLGAGPEEESLKQFANAKLPGRVTFFGAATMAEVKETLYATDVFVIASITDKFNRSEGIPVVSMEALAAECPVVAPRLSGIPELVQNDVTGLLFEPGNDLEMAQKINFAMDNHKEAKRLARQGRDYVLEYYNIDKNADELMHLIEANIT